MKQKIKKEGEIIENNGQINRADYRVATLYIVAKELSQVWNQLEDYNMPRIIRPGRTDLNCRQFSVLKVVYLLTWKIGTTLSY